MSKQSLSTDVPLSDFSSGPENGVSPVTVTVVIDLAIGNVCSCPSIEIALIGLVTSM